MPAKLGLPKRDSGSTRTRAFFIDHVASNRLIELRENRGLSPERLARLINERAEAEGWEVGAVHESTIRRIEGNPRKNVPGVVPSIRVQVVIALFFGIDRQEIWRPGRAIEMELEVSA